MNKILIISLLCALTLGQLTINLKKERVSFTGFEDEICYHQALFNKDSTKTKAVFDSTTHESWRVVTTGAGTETTTGINLMVNVRQATTVKDDIEIEGHKLKQVDFVEGTIGTSPTGVPTPNPWTKDIKAGFALGLGRGSFLKEVTQIEKLEYESFSFYFRESNGKDITQLKFGAPEGFFSTGPPTLFQTQPNVGDDGLWILHVTNVGLDASNTKAWNTNAYFNTATRYSSITPTQYNWLKTTLTNYYGILFSNGDQCPCKSDKKPQIFFQFSNGPSASHNVNTLQKFTLDYEDFVVKDADGTCHLAFKAWAREGEQIVLGTSFLKGIYAWFYNPGQGQPSIRLANAYKVNVQPVKMNENYRLAFIIVGIIILALSLLFLLSVLKKVPYFPAPQVQGSKGFIGSQGFQGQGIQQGGFVVQPQSYVIQQQPVLGQTTGFRGNVSPNQMIYSQAPRSVSPQRVYQQY